MNTVTQCGISDASDFECLWELPKLPLTERFGSFKSSDALSFNQELLISVPTGHVQLRNQVAPDLLYASDTYSFRTGLSTSSNSSVRFFQSYLDNLIDGRNFRSAVDIGGNDLSVARGLLKAAKFVAVVDPICAPQDGQRIDGVQVLGRFVESVDLAAELEKPDLVVCRHTLEHIANPREFIAQLFDQCAPECLYVFEVPCLGNLVESLRFDTIMHQHYHYFDIHSITRLLWECGGEIVNHSYNYQGSCGGALFVSFRRARSGQTRPEVDIRERISCLKAAIARYQAQTIVMAAQLENLPGPVYGYGASLMLATLAYQLKTNFAKLECILDDDPRRDGMTYENVPVQVGFTGRVSPLENSSYVITSLENVRGIYRRILELKPRRILVPIMS